MDSSLHRVCNTWQYNFPDVISLNHSPLERSTNWTAIRISIGQMTALTPSFFW